MIQSRANAWRQYLSLRGERSQSRYRYPTGEAFTDESEVRQDPMKRERELELIAGAVPAHADLVVDFGCGAGRNFETLRRSVSDDALSIAIEPDRRRMEMAAGNRQGFRVLHGSVEIIEHAPPACTIDHLSCCQVLGHTPRAVARNAIGTVPERLAVGGTAHFCVPFVNASMRDTDEDFFHEAHLRLPPEDRGFRVESLTR